MRGAGTLLLGLVWGICFAPLCWATVYYSDGSAANVQALQDSAHDGDTIVLPAGTFDWTTAVSITKGITLQGQTTITGAGTGTPAIIDTTIIDDDTPRAGHILTFTLNASQSARLTGITFAPGTTTLAGQTDGAVEFNCSQSSSPNTGIRLDHCHFAALYQSHSLQFAGWIYGVADHNVIECRGGNLSIFFEQSTWGGPSQGQNGEGSWADYPWYGTEKFVFIEDNTIIGPPTGPQTSANFDVWKGGRYVARHNYFKDSSPNTHGTEGGAPRGTRNCEIYDNTFEWTYSQSSRLLRSGGMLSHDNTWLGVESTDLAHTRFAVYREMGAIGNDLTYWGLATGANPWDMNDPHGFYDAGTTTSGSTFGSTGTITDTSKNWATNQWVGYSVTNTNQAAACYNHSSYIISNTSNTITYYYYSSGDRGAPLVFNAGDAYSIYRLLIAIDQAGRGKGDLTALDVNGRPFNTTTNSQSWTHEALEPCMSWNNVYSVNGDDIGFSSGGIPTEIINRDYYNLGHGFPHDTTPSQVSSIYVAALNGTDYTGTYIYPHPLVSGDPPPTPTPTSTPIPTATPTPSATATSTPISTGTPAAPSNLSAITISSVEIDLAWQNNDSNVDYINVERGTDGINFQIITQLGYSRTSMSDSGLNAGRTYYYRVRAHNANGFSNYSNVASATTLGASPTPSPTATPTSTPRATPTATPRPTPTPRGHGKR